MDLDIRGAPVSSDNLVSVTRGLPITGVQIYLDDPGHVSACAGWLECRVPASLRCLDLYIGPDYPTPLFELQASQVACLLSPLRSAGAQLQALQMRNVDLSQAGSISIIIGLTQLTSLHLVCKFHDDGWALLEPAFACLEVRVKERFYTGDGMSCFYAETALLSQV